MTFKATLSPVITSKQKPVFPNTYKTVLQCDHRYNSSAYYTLKISTFKLTTIYEQIKIN